MSSPSFYTAAGNFIDSVQGGVDPRTGTYNIKLPLINVSSGSLAGPLLTLSLSYSPLSQQEEGFGKGMSLNLTRYDVSSRLLILSNGEKYPISSSGSRVREIKGKDFLFRMEGDNHKVIYKSGFVDFLGRFGNVFVTERLMSPNGRNIQFFWKELGGRPALARVIDDSGTLLNITYPTASINATTVTVLPDNADSGFNLNFDFSDELLSDVTIETGILSMAWRFMHGDIGPARLKAIVGIISPLGSKEIVSYFPDRGMAFPDKAGRAVQPCVHQHTLIPGGDRSGLVTTWEWTPENYLGKGASIKEWKPDVDAMMETLLPQFRYGSTAKIREEGNDAILRSVTYEYNSYHLQVSETTTSKGRKYSRTTEYYASYGMRFEEQPAQFRRPKLQTESWSADGSASRTLTTRWVYNSADNLVSQMTPDGTTTNYVYYPHVGDDRACPKDMYNFACYLKSTEVIPPRIKGDESTTVTTITWKKLMGLFESDGLYMLVPDVVTENKGAVKTVVTHEYYDNTANVISCLREKERTLILTQNNKSFTSKLFYSYEVTDNGIRRTEILTSHDNLTLTNSTLWHPRLGYLLSETNEQGVTVDFTYDKLGRQLTQTVAAGTAYQRISKCSYDLIENQLVVLETDTKGSKIKTFFDGAGQEIKKQVLDADGSQTWFDVSEQTYNAFGDISSSSVSDWLTSLSRRYRISSDISYDGWGMISEQSFSDNTTAVRTTDMVNLTQTNSLSGGGGNNRICSGTVMTSLDKRSLLPLSEVSKDTLGNITNTYHYEWDGLGRLRQVIENKTNITLWTYDDFDRPLTQTLPDGTEVRWTYAPHLTGKNVTSIGIIGKNYKGELKQWILGKQQFDGLGRITQLDHCGRITRYDYERTSWFPRSVTSPSLNVTNYEYIPEMGNAIKAISMAEGRKQTFDYDTATGALLRAQEGDTLIENTLSPWGYLKSERFVLNTVTDSAEYTRMLSGGIKTYTDIAGKITQYNRDKFGRITRIKDDELTVKIKYNSLGYLTKEVITDADSQRSLTIDLLYDDFGRKLKQTITDGTNSTLIVTQSWSKTNQLAGRITEQDGILLSAEEYTYDSRNRLVSYSVNGSARPLDGYGHKIKTQKYQYDCINNLTVVATQLANGGEDVATYKYDNIADPTQLTSVIHTHTDYPQSITLKYDVEGRMTQDEAGRKLTYDSQGRLTGISNQVSYGYDALNRMVTQSLGANQSRLLYYRENELISEKNTRSEKALSLIKSGHSYYGVSDGYSVTLLAGDENGSLLWSHAPAQTNGKKCNWSPYGSGDSESSLPGFNGERKDPVSNMYHLGNGYRAYNPVLMRFNCPDSLSPFSGGGLNPYAYCSGDPVNNTDPSGHIDGWNIAMIVLGAIGLLSVGGAMITAASTGTLPALSAGAWTWIGLGVLADTALITSGATSTSDPELSAVLGYVALGAGLAELGTGVALGLGFLKTYRYNLGRPRIPKLFNSSRHNRPRGATPLGDNFYLFRSPGAQSNHAIVTSHGAQSMFPIYTNYPTGTKIRYYSQNGAALFDPGLTLMAAGKYKPREELTGAGRAAFARNYNLYKYESDTYSFMRYTAQSFGVDVIGIRNRSAGNFYAADLKQLFKSLRDNGLHYESIDMVFCRSPRLLPGIAQWAF